MPEGSERVPFVSFGGDGERMQTFTGPVPALADLELAEGGDYREPEWPVPDVEGRVWIQDERIDPESGLSALFEIVDNDELRPVPRWDGVAVLVYWHSIGAGDVRWSPSLVFGTLDGAVFWARSVASDITIRLTTGVVGTWREQPDGDRLPDAVIEAWGSHSA